MSDDEAREQVLRGRQAQIARDIVEAQAGLAAVVPDDVASSACPRCMLVTRIEKLRADEQAVTVELAGVLDRIEQAKPSTPLAAPLVDRHAVPGSRSPDGR